MLRAVSRPWIAISGFQVNFAFAVDHLTLIMLGVVTGVGFLIHLYSAGYMAHEDGYWRFFAYLNLFMFFMLVLVLSSSFLLLFVGWEGVGLASYLLIGFYFKKDSAANAGKKAFVVNRIGDFGFLLAMFLLIAHFGSLDFATVFPAIAAHREWHGGFLTAICASARRRRRRQVRPDSPLRLAARRHGRSHPRLRPHPRRHHGHGRHLHGRPLPTSSSTAAPTPSASSPSSARHRSLRRLHRPRPARHQARPRLLHRLAARLHVPRLRRRRLLGRRLPSAHPRLLQGPALPRRRLRHPRPLRRAGHAPHGRPPQTHPHHLLDHDRRRLRHRRHPALRRLLLKGRDPLPDLHQPQPARQAPLARRPRHRRHDLLLHVPPLVQDLLRRSPLRRTHPRPAPRRRPPPPNTMDDRRTTKSPGRPHHGVHESPWVMLGPLVILAILSVIGGWVGIPAALGGHNEIEHFLDPVFASTEHRQQRLNADNASHATELGLAAVSTLVAARRPRPSPGSSTTASPAPPPRSPAAPPPSTRRRKQVLHRRALQLRHRHATPRLLPPRPRPPRRQGPGRRLRRRRLRRHSAASAPHPPHPVRKHPLLRRLARPRRRRRHRRHALRPNRFLLH